MATCIHGERPNQLQFEIFLIMSLNIQTKTLLSVLLEVGENEKLVTKVSDDEKPVANGCCSEKRAMTEELKIDGESGQRVLKHLKGDKKNSLGGHSSATEFSRFQKNKQKTRDKSIRKNRDAKYTSEPTDSSNDQVTKFGVGNSEAHRLHGNSIQIIKIDTECELYQCELALRGPNIPVLYQKYSEDMGAAEKLATFPDSEGDDMLLAVYYLPSHTRFSSFVCTHPPTLNNLPEMLEFIDERHSPEYDTSYVSRLRLIGEGLLEWNDTLYNFADVNPLTFTQIMNWILGWIDFLHTNAGAHALNGNSTNVTSDLKTPSEIVRDYQITTSKGYMIDIVRVITDCSSTLKCSGTPLTQTFGDQVRDLLAHGHKTKGCTCSIDQKQIYVEFKTYGCKYLHDALNHHGVPTVEIVPNNFNIPKMAALIQQARILIAPVQLPVPPVLGSQPTPAIQVQRPVVNLSLVPPRPPPLLVPIGPVLPPVFGPAPPPPVPPPVQPPAGPVVPPPPPPVPPSQPAIQPVHVAGNPLVEEGRQSGWFDYSTQTWSIGFQKTELQVVPLHTYDNRPIQDRPVARIDRHVQIETIVNWTFHPKYRILFFWSLYNMIVKLLFAGFHLFLMKWTFLNILWLIWTLISPFGHPYLSTIGLIMITFVMGLHKWIVIPTLVSSAMKGARDANGFYRERIANEVKQICGLNIDPKYQIDFTQDTLEYLDYMCETQLYFRKATYPYALGYIQVADDIIWGTYYRTLPYLQFSLWLVSIPFIPLRGLAARLSPLYWMPFIPGLILSCLRYIRNLTRSRLCISVSCLILVLIITTPLLLHTYHAGSTSTLPPYNTNQTLNSGSTQQVIMANEKSSSEKLDLSTLFDLTIGRAKGLIHLLSKSPIRNISIPVGLIQGLTNSKHILDLSLRQLKNKFSNTTGLSNMYQYLTARVKSLVSRKQELAIYRQTFLALKRISPLSLWRIAKCNSTNTCYSSGLRTMLSSIKFSQEQISVALEMMYPLRCKLVGCPEKCAPPLETDSQTSWYGDSSASNSERHGMDSSRATTESLQYMMDLFQQQLIIQIEATILNSTSTNDLNSHHSAELLALTHQISRTQSNGLPLLLLLIGFTLPAIAFVLICYARRRFLLYMRPLIARLLVSLLGAL